MDVEHLDLEEVSRRCARESARYFHGQDHDTRYCFELFRRAFAQRDQGAWGRIYEIYQPLMAGWVQRHKAFPDSGEEVQYFINRSYERMWSAVTQEKFKHFDGLKSVLRYLKMCVGSVIIDHLRVQARLTLEELTDPVIEAARRHDPTLEDRVLGRVGGEDLWERIEALGIDHQEHCVLYGSFVLGLKPRQLLEHYAGVFDDIRQIYRVKENLLARLRRNLDPDEL